VFGGGGRGKEKSKTILKNVSKRKKREKKLERTEKELQMGKKWFEKREARPTKNVW